MHIVHAAKVIATLVACANALPAPESHVLHEKRHATVNGYYRGARVESEAVIPVRIGLVQSGLDQGYEHLMEVSHPSSKNYGKHWTSEEVVKMFAPSDETVDAVRNWLINSGIVGERITHSDNKGWLAFDASVEESEALFLAEYYEHEHATSGAVRIGCDEYHIPKHLTEHVDYITPGVKLSAPVKKTITKRWGGGGPPKQKGPPKHMPPSWSGPPYIPPYYPQLPPDLQDCGRNITPACIRALYDIPTAPAAVKGNSFGIFEDGDFYAQEDLNQFFAEYASNVPQGTHPTLDSIDGAVAPVPLGSEFEGGESAIDFDLAFSLTYPQPVTLYQVDDLHYSTNSTLPGFLNTFLDAIDGSYCTYSAFGETGDLPGVDPVYPDPSPGGYKGQLMCGVYAPTSVISVSYGESEFDLPANYEMRQCNEFMKLGLQGTSVFIASGDYGVAAFPDEDSTNGCLGPESTIFNPDWPSSCPYVTAVGATQLYADQTVLNAESAMHVNLSGTAQNFSTGGGFSNNFARPSYQAAVVETYLTDFDPGYPYYFGSLAVNDVNTTLGLYNRAGRAYPDVSANGAYLRAWLDQVDYHWFGTSLAAPIWGSVMTLINGQRLLKGKKTVGFVNPVLYANPGAMNDIVNGTNVGCGSEGFKAAKGWDPSTGLGTPNYSKLLDVFLSLP